MVISAFNPLIAEAFLIIIGNNLGSVDSTIKARASPGISRIVFEISSLVKDKHNRNKMEV